MRTKPFILLCLMISLIGNELSAQTTTPKGYQIIFTEIPIEGSGPIILKKIAGKVTGPDVSSLRIILYARAGENWWIQPTKADSVTTISKDGTWQNETHLGFMYGALLVRPTYDPANILKALPQLDQSVLAVERVNATKK
jgi:hypothetical protein